MNKVFGIIGVLSIAGFASAAELITNGGFESGATGWGFTSTNDPTAADSLGAFGQPVHAGTSDAWLGGWGTALEAATLTQTVVIPTSSNVTFSFWALSGDAGTATPTTISAKIGSITVFNGPLLTVVPSVGTTFLQFSVNASALSGSQTVSFTYNHPAGGANTNFFIDDVSVLATPVPEPASMAALGLGVLLVVRKRRSSKK